MNHCKGMCYIYVFLLFDSFCWVRRLLEVGVRVIAFGAGSKVFILWRVNVIIDSQHFLTPWRREEFDLPTSVFSVLPVLLALFVQINMHELYAHPIINVLFYKYQANKSKLSLLECNTTTKQSFLLVVSEVGWHQSTTNTSLKIWMTIDSCSKTVTWPSIYPFTRAWWNLDRTTYSITSSDHLKGSHWVVHRYADLSEKRECICFCCY